MKIVLTIFFLISVGVGLCCQTEGINQLTEQEYAVYMVILGERPGNLIVVDHTMVDLFGEISSGKLRDIVPGLLAETVDDYVRRNEKPPTIDKNFPFKDGYRVIRKEERDKLISEFDRHYIVSRVGFSGDGKQAFVLLYDACGVLCGDGAFYLLTNANGVWEIETESEHWRS